MAVTGVVLAVYSALLVPLISNTVNGDDDKKLTKALYWMIIFGCGEVSGALIISRIIDKFGNRTGVITATLVVVCTVAVTVYTHSRERYDVLWFLVALAWGLSDSQTNTVWSTICNSEFETTIEPFAILKFVQSIVVCGVVILESEIKKEDQIEEQRWYLISTGIFSLFCGIACASVNFKSKNRN